MSLPVSLFISSDISSKAKEMFCEIKKILIFAKRELRYVDF